MTELEDIPSALLNRFNGVVPVVVPAGTKTPLGDTVMHDEAVKIGDTIYCTQSQLDVLREAVGLAGMAMAFQAQEEEECEE